MGSTAHDILRPGKRTKLGVAETSSFFDSIPKEVLESVLRYFSKLPNGKKWRTHIDVRDLVGAFGVGGRFAALLKSSFQTLVVSETKICYDQTKDSGWKEIAEPYLWTNDIAVAHAFVVAGAGEALHTLVIGRDMYKRGRDGDNIIYDFRKHCPNITSLSISEEGGVLWAHYNLPTHIHARALRELNMYSYSDNFLVLRSIGDRLERLVISHFHDPRYNNVDKIKQYCPNLKSISLDGRGTCASPAIARILASYGDRLEHAGLYLEDDNLLIDTTTACPNARFHVVADHGYGLSLHTLELIGPRLESVALHHTEAVENEYGYLAEWANAWNECVNLRHLDFVPNKVEDFQVVFSTPKNHLVSINLGLPSYFVQENVKKVMEICENGTKIVETFKCYGPPYYIDEMNGFIEKNRASLRFISLGGAFAKGNKKLDDLLKSFLQLPALGELRVHYDIPGDILKSLRNNGVNCSR